MGNSASQKEWAHGPPFFQQVCGVMKRCWDCYWSIVRTPTPLTRTRTRPFTWWVPPFLLAWHPPHFTAIEAVPNAQRNDTETGSHFQMPIPNHPYRTERSGYNIIAHSWIYCTCLFESATSFDVVHSRSPLEDIIFEWRGFPLLLLCVFPTFQEKIANKNTWKMKNCTKRYTRDEIQSKRAWFCRVVSRARMVLELLMQNGVTFELILELFLSWKNLNIILGYEWSKSQSPFSDDMGCPYTYSVRKALWNLSSMVTSNLSALNSCVTNLSTSYWTTKGYAYKLNSCNKSQYEFVEW